MMMSNHFIKSVRSRLAMLLGLSLMVSMMIAVAAFAVQYTINTTDNTTAEWDNQGIPVFQTDATGDTTNNGNVRDDITETRVATGNDGKLYFLMQTNGSPAVNDLNHSAAAYIDCDRDGVTGEQGDRLVTYIPHYSPLGIGSGTERITLCEGNEAQCAALGPDAGQQVGDHIEWGVTITDLPAGCQNNVDIKFYSAIAVFGSQSTVLDETSLKGWNIPTPVTLSQVHGHTALSWGWALIAIVSMMLLPGILFFWRSRRQTA
jgi:hypothetical protein